MLDIALIRTQPDWVKDQIRKLNDPAALESIDKIVTLDEQRRSLVTLRDTLQGTRNRLNKNVGRLRGDKKLSPDLALRRASSATAALAAEDYEQAALLLEGGADESLGEASGELAEAFDALSQALGLMSDHHNRINEEVKQVEADLQTLMLYVPNMPHESVPVFDSEEHNIAWPTEGKLYEFDFTPRPHWEIGPELGIIDFERGVKLSGSRFYVLQGWGARLQRALASFFLDMARAKGFTELYVPYLVQEGMMEGAGQFPKFREVVYSDPDADLYLLPTAEVAITNMHRDEILQEADLPLNYVAQTPCFRREKSSAGRDVRGIKRVHQFEKVEMYKFTTPETSYAELESMVEAAADIARALALPFRRLEIVTGDLGFSATKKYDLEIWAPGCEEWLEVSSCSNTETFQARRAMIRYYPEGEKKAQFVHTLNGSALALPRVIIAILENYQQGDGSVRIPDALRPYLGGESVIHKA